MNKNKKNWKNKKTENVKKGEKLQQNKELKRIKKQEKNKQDEQELWARLREINATEAKIKESKKQHKKKKLIL